MTGSTFYLPRKGSKSGNGKILFLSSQFFPFNKLSAFNINSPQAPLLAFLFCYLMSYIYTQIPKSRTRFSSHVLREHRKELVVILGIRSFISKLLLLVIAWFGVGVGGGLGYLSVCLVTSGKVKNIPPNHLSVILAEGELRAWKHYSL